VRSLHQGTGVKYLSSNEEICRNTKSPAKVKRKTYESIGRRKTFAARMRVDNDKLWLSNVAIRCCIRTVVSQISSFNLAP